MQKIQHFQNVNLKFQNPDLWTLNSIFIHHPLSIINNEINFITILVRIYLLNSLT